MAFVRTQVRALDFKRNQRSQLCLTTSLRRKRTAMSSACLATAARVHYNWTVPTDFICCNGAKLVSTGFFVTVSLDSIVIVSSHGVDIERRTAWIPARPSSCSVPSFKVVLMNTMLRPVGHPTALKVVWCGTSPARTQQCFHDGRRCGHTLASSFLQCRHVRVSAFTWLF